MASSFGRPEVRSWSSSTPAPPSSRGPGSPTASETWREKLYAALPLFMVGVACVVISIELYFSGTLTALGGGGSVRLRPWILFVALGITGISAGTITLLATDDWAGQAGEQESLPPSPPSPPPAPDWDESTLQLSKATSVFAWRGDLDAEPTDEPKPEHLAPDLVMTQLDEIEASLRKKTRPPPED